MQLKYMKLKEGVKSPIYGSDGSACFDIYGHELVSQQVWFGRGAPTLTVSTALAFEIPEGKALLIHSRSGHGFKHGIRLANVCGIIDSDYRGEVMLKFIMDNERMQHYGKLAAQTLEAFANEHFIGKRCAQAMLIDAPIAQLTLVGELSPTRRGDGGFGSTGAE